MMTLTKQAIETAIEEGDGKAMGDDGNIKRLK